MSKKILIIVNELDYFISHRLNIALEAKREGYEVNVCYGENKSTNLNLNIKKNFNFFYVPIKRGNLNPIHEIRSIYKIYYLIKKIKPTLIHLVTLKPCLYGGLASYFQKNNAILFALPGLGTVYNSDKKIFIIIKNLINLLFKVIFKKNNCYLILQNNNDKKYLIKKKIIDKSKIKIIKGSGVNLNYYKYFKENQKPIIISFISRLLIEKGISYFISAAKIIRNRTNLNIKFWVFGSLDPGNPQSVSKIDLIRWKKEGHVDFKGFTKNMRQVLRKTNIVCLPSYYREGLPKILLEAAASGRSIVTTDHPGCRDAIIPNVTGYLVPIKNSRKLADKLEFLALKKNVRLKMGKKARLYAEKSFSETFIAQQHMKLYKKLTGNN